MESTSGLDDINYDFYVMRDEGQGAGEIRSEYHNYYTFLTQINCRLGAVLLIVNLVTN